MAAGEYYKNTARNKPGGVFNDSGETAEAASDIAGAVKDNADGVPDNNKVKDSGSGAQNRVKGTGEHGRAGRKKTESAAEVNALRAELEQTVKELEQQKDIALRTAAEFDNYKRRTERERLSAGEYARAQTIKSLLPALDNIDRALSADPMSPDYAKGVEMIVKQLNESMVALGLDEIEAEGKNFDPNLHEAVMHIEDDAYGENEVVQVLQKGYQVGDTVIRPAMVKVAN